MGDQIISFAYGIVLRLALYYSLANNPITGGFLIGFHDSLRLWSVKVSNSNNSSRSAYRYHHLAIYYFIETAISRSVTRTIAILLGWVIGALAAEIGPGLLDDVRGIDLRYDVLYKFQANSFNLSHHVGNSTSQRPSGYRTNSNRSAAASLTAKPGSSFEKKSIPATHAFDNLRDPLHGALNNSSELSALENSDLLDIFVVAPTESAIYSDSDATPRISSMNLPEDVAYSSTHIHSFVLGPPTLSNGNNTNRHDFSTIRSSLHSKERVQDDYEHKHVIEDESVSEYKTENSVSESIITTESQAALIDRADGLRSQAQGLIRKLDILEHQRSTAFREGKFFEAFAMKHERNETRVLMEKLNERARRRYYKAHNSKPHGPFTIDIHRHHVQEAIRIIEVALRDIQRSGERVLHVIVGRGLHSPRRFPVLKNSVQRVFKEQGFIVQINKKNPGMLDIEFPQ